MRSNCHLKDSVEAGLRSIHILKMTAQHQQVIAYRGAMYDLTELNSSHIRKLGPVFEDEKRCYQKCQSDTQSL